MHIPCAEWLFTYNKFQYGHEMSKSSFTFYIFSFLFVFFVKYRVERADIHISKCYTDVHWAVNFCECFFCYLFE